jgi:hypothetical protein
MSCQSFPCAGTVSQVVWRFQKRPLQDEDVSKGVGTMHAYYADLVLIARPEPAGQTAGPPGLAESLVLIIVFPPRGTVSAPFIYS